MPSVNNRRGAGSRGGVFHRGGEGRKRVEEEVRKAQERAENAGKGFGPMRFFLLAGEEKTFVVLDEEPDFFLYEHTLKDPSTGKYTNHVVCPGQYATCPICESGNYAAYIMVLSVLDLTPFTRNDGTVEEFSRKLLIVKPSQQKQFLRKFEREGSLRGAMFVTARDTKQDAAIGNDIELIDYMPEDELANEYWREWTDRDKKHHEENCGEPFVYEEIFKEPTDAELHAIAGTSPDDVPGSRKQSRSVDESDYSDGDEKPKRGRNRSNARGSGAASRNRGSSRRVDTEDADDTGDPPFDPDDAGGDEPPVRTRRGAGSRRASREDPEGSDDSRPSRRKPVERQRRRR